MRVFVFEYITGGGLLGRELFPALVQEGELMVQALLGDLVELDGTEVVTLRDARLPPFDLPVHVHTLYHSRDLMPQFRRALNDCDAVWPIAPETGGELERLSAAVLESKRLLLGSRPEAIGLAASKLRTFQRLAEHGVPIIPTWSGTDVLDGTTLPAAPWVIKPDDGIGCSDTCIVGDRGELDRIIQSASSPSAYVIQPLTLGTHISLSVLVGNNTCEVLTYNTQRMVVVNNEFRFVGCVVNGVRTGRAALDTLARMIVAALPGLWGYFGADLILTEDGPRVLEINPRLTTPYAGVSRALGVNVAGLVLGMLDSAAPLQPHIMHNHTVALNLEVDYVA